MVYMAGVQPSVYDDLSIALFMSIYLTVMAAEKPQMKVHTERHLQELISDSELYGWPPVRSFHAVWL